MNNFTKELRKIVIEEVKGIKTVEEINEMINEIGCDVVSYIPNLIYNDDVKRWFNTYSMEIMGAYFESFEEYGEDYPELGEESRNLEGVVIRAISFTILNKLEIDPEELIKDIKVLA